MGWARGEAHTPLPTRAPKSHNIRGNKVALGQLYSKRNKIQFNREARDLQLAMIIVWPVWRYVVVRFKWFHVQILEAKLLVGFR